MNDGSSPAPVVEAVGLTKTYSDPPVVVFEDVHFALPPRRLAAIVGPSGAGKSTLLHLLGGLDRPTRGAVRFGGASVFDLNPVELARFRNRHIGFVFQFHHLLPEFTVLENAAMPCIIRGEGRAGAEEKARSLLERVGLGPRLTHKVGEISGGEQQRVAIARALVGKPELLLADEPTGNLDQKAGESVFEMVRELHAERGLTSVIVTHNEKIAEQCDEVWVMEGGKLQNRNCSSDVHRLE
jgi:lipoprotein-releasing system ATP-binding protein